MVGNLRACGMLPLRNYPKRIFRWFFGQTHNIYKERGVRKRMMKSPKDISTSEKSSRMIWIVLAILFIAGLIVILFGVIILFMGNIASPRGDGNVALIPIKGMIVTDDGLGLFSKGVASSTKIIEQIKAADTDPSIKAIIFEINSPGGGAVASDEIARVIKATNKTTVAWIRDVGASGAYWIASSTDAIVANRMSITGSIGVISSYLEFSGLEQRYNVTYQRLVAGKYKDIGSPFKPLTTEEELFMQERLDTIHNVFIEEVAHNRNLPVEQVTELANGLFYLGQESKDLGLVDILGSKEDAIMYIEEVLGIKVTLKEFKERKSVLDLLAETFAQPKIVVMTPQAETVPIRI